MSQTGPTGWLRQEANQDLWSMDFSISGILPEVIVRISIFTAFFSTEKFVFWENKYDPLPIHGKNIPINKFLYKPLDAARENRYNGY